MKAAPKKRTTKRATQKEFLDRVKFVRSLSTDEPKVNPLDFPEITDKKKRLYLQAVARYPGLTTAAQVAGISPKTAWNWRQDAEDTAFAAAFDVARSIGLTRAESELWRRGIDGYDAPVYHMGELVGVERKFDTTAAIFMLKGALPDVYRERHEHSGPKGGPLEVSVYAHLTDDELRRRVEVVRDTLQNVLERPRNDERPVIDVTPQDTPEARYEAILALRKANGNGNGSNGNGSNGHG
jgi:hypothetical protein